MKGEYINVQNLAFSGTRLLLLCYTFHILRVFDIRGDIQESYFHCTLVSLLVPLLK